MKHNTVYLFWGIIAFGAAGFVYLTSRTLITFERSSRYARLDLFSTGSSTNLPNSRTVLRNLTMEILKQRQLQMQKACLHWYGSLRTLNRTLAAAESLQPIMPNRLAEQSIWVMESHNFLFCTVAKVASTSWKKFLIFFSGCYPQAKRPEDVPDELVHTSWNFSSKCQLKRLSDYRAQSEKLRIMSTFKKAIFVRHPVIRAVSAWYSKLGNKKGPNKDYAASYGRKILKLYAKGLNQSEIEAGYPVQLADFVRYLLDHTFPFKLTDIHWSPFHSACSPCSVHYNYIGHFENLADEVSFILEQILGFDPSGDFFVPKFNREGYDRHLEQQLAMLPRKMQRNLADHYEIDLDMFGYARREIH